MYYEELVKLLYYDNGVMKWKDTMGPNAKKGSYSSSVNSDGYMHVYYRGKSHKLHRLVFLYHKGYLPKYIDHINGNGSDNRIENLRECSSSQNQINTGTSKNNTSGYKGVTFHKCSGKWRARSCKNGRRVSLGLHSNPLLAASAVVRFEQSNHPEFTRF